MRITHILLQHLPGNNDKNKANDCIQPCFLWKSFMEYHACYDQVTTGKGSAQSVIMVIFLRKIFNDKAQAIKVFYLLRACDTNQKPNWLKVKIPFEVDLTRFLPSFTNASDSIYILFAAINFYGPTVTSRTLYLPSIYKNYAKLCDDKTVTTKATKTVLGDRSFQESVYILFYIQRNAFQKETSESIFHTSLEDQDKIRDLWLQPVSNGCQIDSLIPNAWVNGTVITAFLKEASKTSSYSNAVFSTDIFQNILGRRLNQEFQNAWVDSNLLQRDVMAIPIFHKGGQHWSMASVYPKLKLILHFDSKHSVYLDVFQVCMFVCLIFTKKELPTNRYIFRSESVNVCFPKYNTIPKWRL